MGTWRSHLEKQRLFRQISLPGTKMFDLVLIPLAKIIKPEAVFGLIHNR